VSEFSFVARQIDQVFYTLKTFCNKVDMWLRTRVLTQFPNAIASSVISDREKIVSGCDAAIAVHSENANREVIVDKLDQHIF